MNPDVFLTEPETFTLTAFTDDSKLSFHAIFQQGRFNIITLIGVFSGTVCWSMNFTCTTPPQHISSHLNMMITTICMYNSHSLM